MSREITFGCCFCGEEVNPSDKEASQVCLIYPWGEDEEGSEKESKEQYWFAHRKPCFEAALNPGFRIFEDDETDWEIFEDDETDWEKAMEE